MDADQLLADLWADYTAITPLAARVHALLTARGETIVNDHVALRTFGLPGVGIEVLAAPFEALGWVVQPDRYRFEDKKLVARYWQHPDPTRPKIFISELCVDELPGEAQSAIRALVAQMKPGATPAGRPWTISHATYGALLVHSEYAAWMAAFGFRVNHFTVDIGPLKTIKSIAEINELLAGAGFALNTSGGAIKGSPAERLEQSSTRAEEIEVPFDDVTVRIPSCYYEFAKRYPLPDGSLFQGFVPASADKIFESTDVVT